MEFEHQERTVFLNEIAELEDVEEHLKSLQNHVAMLKQKYNEAMGCTSYDEKMEFLKQAQSLYLKEQIPCKINISNFTSVLENAWPYLKDDHKFWNKINPA